VIGRNKSLGPDSIPGVIRKIGGETMINKATIPTDWKEAIFVPIHKAGDSSVVKNYRPVSLTSVVCKQMEHAKAGWIQVWEDRD